MSGRPPSDARWRPVLALAIVALSTGVLAKLTPEEGWQVGGLTWRWSLPAPWQAWFEPEETAPIVPRWKPEDVEDLLARYDAELSQAETRLDSTAATQPVAVEDTAAVPGPDSVATRPPRTAPVSAPSPAAAPSQASSWVPGALRIRLPESNPDAPPALEPTPAAGGCLHPPLRRQPNRRRPHFRHVARTVARTVGWIWPGHPAAHSPRPKLRLAPIQSGSLAAPRPFRATGQHRPG